MRRIVGPLVFAGTIATLGLDAGNACDMAGNCQIAPYVDSCTTALWRMEEELGNELLDSSGNGSVMTINGATRIDSGKFGRAVSFDGVDDWASAGNNPILNSGSFTYEAWIRFRKIPDHTASYLIISKYGSGSFGGRQLAIYWDGHPYCYISSSETFGTGNAISPDTITQNTWHHLAGSYDSASNIVSLYINGCLVAAAPGTDKTVSQWPVYIGRSAIGNPAHFSGDLDEIRISNVARSFKCFCGCHADPICDRQVNILDVVETVNVAFRGQTIEPDESCTVERTDVDCSDLTNVVDVVKMIDVAFRSADPAVKFCDPCGD